MARFTLICLSVASLLCAIAFSRWASAAEYPFFESGFDQVPLQVLALEPAIALDQEGVAATAHVEGLFETPAAVRLIGPSAQQVQPAFSFDTQAPGLLDIDVPAGLATGEWELQVDRADSASTGALAAALTVVDTVSLGFSVNPQSLPVAGGELRLTSPGEFAGTPQVLLRLAAAPDSEPAVPLQGVKVYSAFELTAPLPAGFAVGTYDVIVINPDGVTGIASDALYLSANAPPKVESVFPAYLSNSVTAISVMGSGFNVSSVITVVCSDSGLQPVFSIVFVDSTQLTFEVDRTAAGDFETCLVNILNPDGQADSFSGLLMTPSSGNPGPINADSQMGVARRAAAAASVRVDSSGWRIYAIGGDDGTLANALDSVEFASTSPHGAIDAWQTSRQQLPGGRTFAWAAGIGRFIYLVGGSNGTDPQASVLRAQVLDQADAPVLVRHTLRAWPQATLVAGQYSYQVSAVFPNDDLVNPGGESLAGRPRHFSVPASPKVVVDLDWEAVPGASGYRVYRLVSGGDIELVAETALTRWFDDGSATPDPASTPLAEGETGKWHSVSGWQLNTARSHFAGAVSPVPGDPDAFALYALGGEDSDGDKLDSYEYSLISSAGSASPVLGSWSLGADSLPLPVSNSGAWAVSNQFGTDTHWIFVAGGFDDAGDDQRFVERGQVSAGGDLGTLSPAATDMFFAAGGSPISRPNMLDLVGGRSGVASNNGQYCTLSDDGSGPVTSNWNTASGADGTFIIYAASVPALPFWYIVGGYNGTDGALATVFRVRP